MINIVNVESFLFLLSIFRKRSDLMNGLSTNWIKRLIILLIKQTRKISRIDNYLLVNRIDPARNSIIQFTRLLKSNWIKSNFCKHVLFFESMKFNIVWQTSTQYQMIFQLFEFTYVLFLREIIFIRVVYICNNNFFGFFFVFYLCVEVSYRRKQTNLLRFAVKQCKRKKPIVWHNDISIEQTRKHPRMSTGENASKQQRML